MPDGIIDNEELANELSKVTGYKSEVWDTGGGCRNAVLLLEPDYVSSTATYLMFPNGGWPIDDPAEQMVGLYNDTVLLDPDGYDSEGVSFRTPFALTTANEVACWIGDILARFFTA